jgi:DNA-binding LacI/PurR family transcriptional regulator
MLQEKKAVNLKTVAAKVGLAPCSVSAILNDTQAARAIPQATKDRVYRAAAELNYRPNFMARSLRTKRTRMVAILAPDLGRSAVARVVAAAQKRLHECGYMLVLAASDDGDRMCAQFLQRGIEGVISIEANVPSQLNVPVTSVDLGYPISATHADWVSSAVLDIGDAAAESIMQQIENEGSSRKIKLRAAAPAYMHMRNIDMAFTAPEGA